MLIILLLVIPFGTACATTTLEWARGQVKVGMSREQAVSTLGKRSWYYQACPNLNSVDDVFFFGEHSYEKAEVVILTSVKKDGVYFVADIGTLETNAWHAAYKDCVLSERFTK
jgi:hypothetical protein